MAVYWGMVGGGRRIETDSVDLSSTGGIPTGISELRLVSTLVGNRSINFWADFWRIFSALNPRSFLNRFWFLYSNRSNSANSNFIRLTPVTFWMESGINIECPPIDDILNLTIISPLSLVLNFLNFFLKSGRSNEEVTNLNCKNENTFIHLRPLILQSTVGRNKSFNKFERKVKLAEMVCRRRVGY